MIADTLRKSPGEKSHELCIKECDTGAKECFSSDTFQPICLLDIRVALTVARSLYSDHPMTQ